MRQQDHEGQHGCGASHQRAPDDRGRQCDSADRGELDADAERDGAHKDACSRQALSGSPVGERPPDQRTSGLAHRDEGDVGDNVGEPDPTHSGKPTCKPLALDRPYRPDHNRSERRKSSKDRVAQDEWQAAVLIRHIASDGCWCGNQQHGQDSAERRQSGQQDKQRPPSVRAHEERRRIGHHERAEPCDRYEAPRHQAETFTRKPCDDRLHCREERRGGARTEQRAANHEAEGSRGQAEYQCAEGRHSPSSPTGRHAAQIDRSRCRTVAGRPRKPPEMPRSAFPACPCRSPDRSSDHRQRADLCPETEQTKSIRKRVEEIPP